MKKIIIPVLFILILFTTACGKDEVPIENMSQDVYEQIVEQYYFIEASRLIYDKEGGLTKWYEEDPNYEEDIKSLEEYIEDNDLDAKPIEIFPNPLFFDYVGNQSDYTEEETHYIELAIDMFSHNMLLSYDDPEYDKIKNELAEDLEIEAEENKYADLIGEEHCC